jgi:hypothetical protein
MNLNVIVMAMVRAYVGESHANKGLDFKGDLIHNNRDKF